MEIVLKAKKNRRQGKKGRKIGRNKAFCIRYRASGTRMKNKAKKAQRERIKREKATQCK